MVRMMVVVIIDVLLSLIIAEQNIMMRPTD